MPVLLWTDLPIRLSLWFGYNWKVVLALVIDCLLDALMKLSATSN